MESPFKEDILKGKVALVTGGGSGIGLEISKQFGKHGASVAIMGRRNQVLDSAVSTLRSFSIPAVGFEGDVRKQEDAKRVVESTVNHFGRLDILVNAAAGNFLVASEDLSPNGFRTVMDIDSVGTFTMCHEALEYLKRGGPGRGSSSGGVILNISATLHYTAAWYQIHVSAAKAAVDAITRNLALEWGTDYDIRVNGIAPGPIGDTPGMSKLAPELKGEEMAAEKDRSRGSAAAAREKDIKKEAERKHQDKRKEKDKGSSKSNSDAEELERRAGKETERKWEFDRKSEADRWESHRTGLEHAKTSGTEMAHGIKVANTNKYSPGKTGTRYLDRMRGTIFGKGANTAAAMSRENKPNDSVDHVHASTNWRESFQSGKNLSSDDKIVSHPVVIEPQPPSVPKKSWHQLFSRSSAFPQPTNSNVISRPNGKPQAQVQSPPLAGHSFPAQSYSNPIEFGLPSPFTFPSVSTSNGFVPPLTPKPMFPRFGEGRHDFLPDESEMFGDPCYVPNPVSLLGPVSESLNNFQLDLCTGFSTDMGVQKPRSLKNISATAECSRPSPIESPMSRVQYASTMKAQNMHPSPISGLSNANAGGTWQMWSTSSLGQDGLGLVGGSASWLLSPDLNSSNKEDLVHPTSHKTMTSLFTKNGQALTSTCSPQNVFLGNCQNGGTYFASVRGGTLDPWLPQTLVGTVPGTESNFPHNSPEEASQNDMIYGGPRAYTTNHPAALSPANFAKKDWAMQCSGENNQSTPVTRAHIGGLYSTRDAQSLWSYD